MAICELCKQDMLKSDGCTCTFVQFADDKRMERIKYGAEKRYVEIPEYLQSKPGDRCPDCNVVYGNFHHPGCDIEECPRCGLQFISCDCNLAEE